MPIGIFQTLSAVTVALGSTLFLLLVWQSVGTQGSLRPLSVVFALMILARFCELLPSLRWIGELSDLATGILLLWRAWVLWPDRHNISRSFTLLRQGIGPTQLADAAGRYDALFSNAGLGIALRDSITGRVLEWNPRYLEITGRRQQSLLRNSEGGWTKAEFQSQEEDLRKRLISREIPSYELTKQIVLPDGSERWVRVWATLANGGGKTMDVLADVDQEMRASAERDQSLERLEVLYRERDGITLACAHDLKAPVRQGGLRLQQALELTGEAQIQKIKEAIALGNRLGKLIDELLEYGRLGQESDMTMMAVPIVEIARSIAYQYDDEARFFIDSDLPMVRCSPQQIERLFTNLYSNSIKHGNGNTEIHVSNRGTSGKFAVIDVSDNGPGVDEFLRDSLFQLFVKGEDSTGTGLGLAICQKIVVAHGGKIELIPSEEGACFRIHLLLV